MAFSTVSWKLVIQLVHKHLKYFPSESEQGSIASGVSKVNVTRCGSWWCHPYLKNWWLF